MTEAPFASFGFLLRTYRMAAGLTQEELAGRAGMSARSISDLEREALCTPDKSTVELLVRALHLSPQESSAFLAAARQRTASSERLSDSLILQLPLVGRAQELALLDTHLEDPGPPLLLLAGESGIGKTRLLEEIARRARQRGWSVLQGGCTRRGGQTLYSPVLEALGGHVHAQSPAQLRTKLEGCGWLTRFLPELTDLMPQSPSKQQLPPEQERRLMFAAVARYLANSAGPAGTLLLLDDLQWTGEDTLDLLTTLIHPPFQSPFRLIGAYRNTEVLPRDPLFVLMADLAREGSVRHLELDPLEPDAAATFTTYLLEDAAGDREALTRRVLERSGGVPFFLVSYARALLPSTLETQPRSEEHGAMIPWDIRQTIRQRIAQLPDATQEIVGVAAVVGRQARGEVLLATATRPEQEVLAALDLACQARLLMEEKGTYRFAHDMIREVVEADLSEIRQRVLHRRVAMALEHVPGECPTEILAYHYGRAEAWDAALRFLIQAAGDARRTVAPHEEANLLTQAIDIAGRIGQHQMGVDLRMRRGTVYRAVARWAEADRDLTATLGSMSFNHDEQRAEALVTLAEVRHWRLDVPSTRRYASEALALAEQMGRDDLAARSMGALALAESSDGAIQASLDHFQHAFTRAGPHHLAALVSGVELAGLIQYWLGHFEKAVDRNQHALELAKQTYDTTSMARAQANLGLALGGSGRYAEAFQRFAEARQFARDHRMEQWLARATSMCGGLHLEVLDFERAEALAEEAREISRSVNWPLAETSGGIDLLLKFVRCQELGRAERLLPEVAEAAMHGQGAHGWLWRLRLTQARAEIALARGNWEEARSLAQEGIEQSRLRGRVKYQVLGLEARAKALNALNQTHEAIASLEHAVSLARRTRNPALFLRAALAHLLLDGNDALRKEAQRAIDAITEELPDERMKRQFLSAEAVRAQLGETTFAQLLSEGRLMTREQTVSDAFATTDVAVPPPTSQKAPQASFPPAVPTAPASPAGLSARETEVLRLVAAGLTNAQIAEQLVISPRTVDAHLTSIYSKIGVKSRTAATRYAFEHHLA